MKNKVKKLKKITLTEDELTGLTPEMTKVVKSKNIHRLGGVVLNRLAKFTNEVLIDDENNLNPLEAFMLLKVISDIPAAIVDQFTNKELIKLCPDDEVRLNTVIKALKDDFLTNPDICDGIKQLPANMNPIFYLNEVITILSDIEDRTGLKIDVDAISDEWSDVNDTVHTKHIETPAEA